MFISQEPSQLKKINKLEELSLLDKLSLAQGLISDTIIKEDENTQIKDTRIEDAKAAFLKEVPDVAQLVLQLDGIREKDLVERLKNLFNL